MHITRIKENLTKPVDLESSRSNKSKPNITQIKRPPNRGRFYFKNQQNKGIYHHSRFHATLISDKKQII